MSNKDQNTKTTQYNEHSKSPFVFKPFVQTPNSVIKAEKSKEVPIWADRWGRRCGNP